MIRVLLALVALFQAIFAVRVIARLLRTANGLRIERRPAPNTEERVSVLVPVLNEVHRLTPCLDGLIAQGDEVAEILVIDGGSSDGTQDLIRRLSQRDPRVRLIDATPVPEFHNGKAHNLQAGLTHSDSATGWTLTIDADVRPAPDLVSSLLAHATAAKVPTLSAATRQHLSGAAEGVVHPSMLATLVYRYGIPGHATTDVAQVQANGQCFLARREVLEATGGFATGYSSVCEDVTVARAIAAQGHPVGFYETADLVSVEMYAGWREAWDNWTRSLPMKDRYANGAGFTGMAEILLVQAMPALLAPLAGAVGGRRHPATLINIALLCTRIGILAGISRAYVRKPWTYWLSPLCDLPVALRLASMARRRQHTWRGRALAAGDSE